MRARAWYTLYIPLFQRGTSPNSSSYRKVTCIMNHWVYIFIFNSYHINVFWAFLLENSPCSTELGKSDYFVYRIDDNDDVFYSSIHMAVIHEQIQALRSMLEICKATNTMNAVHQLNSERQVRVASAILCLCEKNRLFCANFLLLCVSLSFLCKASVGPPKNSPCVFVCWISIELVSIYKKEKLLLEWGKQNPLNSI